MTPSKKNRKRDTKTRREERILVISLLILYAVFVYSAFVKCDFCWGINYLFYFPAWIKLTFVILGGICFIPEFNSIIHSAFLNLAQIIAIIYRYKKQNAVYQIIFYPVFVAVFAFVFYHFRIYSLYHAPMGAIYFMERNIPIGEYYRNWVLVEDKYSLLLLWAAARYLFKQVLNFTNYQSLAATSVLFGIFFMLLLQYFISRLREYNPFEKLLLFVLIFTQGITYYYFGFANYYAPLPVVIFAYVVAVILYFRGETGIYVPLFLGIFAVIVHLGAVFILPSMVFIVLHRFRSSLDFLYALTTFRNYGKSLYALVSVIILGYVLIAIGMPYSRALSEYFVPPFVVAERYGFPLFSMQYVIHLVNMLLLSSPVGIVLFIIYLNRIQKSDMFDDGKYALLWIAIAGVLHQVFLLPQTIFAWDVFAWTSIGYTVLASFLLIHILKVSKNRRYYATIVAAHCSIYFISWILLNNNPYASVLNYLDTAQKYDPQLAWCLQILGENYRAEDREEIADLMSVLKTKASDEREFLNMGVVYDKIGDSEGLQIMVRKYMLALQQNIKENPANPDNYYQLIRLIELNDLPVKDREYLLDAYYARLIELRPTNIQYLGMAGYYYSKKHDYANALPFYLKADSLYDNQDISPFTTPGKRYEIKSSLLGIYYQLQRYAEVIKNFEQAVAFGLSKNDGRYKPAVSSLVDSYFGLGNSKKALDLLEMYENDGVELEFDKDFMSKQDYGINRRKQAQLLIHLLKSRKLAEFREVYRYATEDTVYDEYRQFETMYQLIESDAGNPDGFHKAKYDSLFELPIRELPPD